MRYRLQFYVMYQLRATRHNCWVYVMYYLFDGVLIPNELIDSGKRSKVEGVIFKIDLEKTYDYVDWDFFSYMLLIFIFWKSLLWLAAGVHLYYIFICSN